MGLGGLSSPRLPRPRLSRCRRLRSWKLMLTLNLIVRFARRRLSWALKPEKCPVSISTTQIASCLGCLFVILALFVDMSCPLILEGTLLRLIEGITWLTMKMKPLG
uniref:Uncharacterized protein n=1 Tax=Opuntia streptacantha TaxID=393608 RepID=A0A7C9FAI2_OPUST